MVLYLFVHNFLVFYAWLYKARTLEIRRALGGCVARDAEVEMLRAGSGLLGIT